MKRIEFIAPVEAMRGNLSGNQVLEYPVNDNPAFDAPEGKSYARNYQPRFIGAKRSSTGLKYFSVKTKSAINKTAKSILAMAVLGGAGAIYAAILADATIYANAQAAFVPNKGKTFRAWLMDGIMESLRLKRTKIEVQHLVTGVYGPLCNNPFVSGGQSQYNVTISDEVLVKFWAQLANNPITFSVAGLKGIAHSGDDFNSVVTKNYNVLGLTKVMIEALGEMIKLGNMYVTREVEDAPITVQDIDIVDPSENYFLDSEYHTAE